MGAGVTVTQRAPAKTDSDTRPNPACGPAAAGTGTVLQPAFPLCSPNCGAATHDGLNVDHAFEGVAYERRLLLLEMKNLPQIAFA